MTSVSKYVYIDKLDKIVNKCNNTYYNAMKMKPVDVKAGTYIDFGIENNEKDPKFKVGYHVRISKYKCIFPKGYVPNSSKDVVVIKKVKNTVPWTYIFSDIHGEEIVGTFYKKNYKTQIKNN